MIIADLLLFNKERSLGQGGQVPCPALGHQTRDKGPVPFVPFH